MKYIFTTLLILFTSLTYAKNIEIVMITNDEDRAISKFYIEVDQDNNLIGFCGKKFIDDKIVEEDSYGDKIQDSSGVVMRESSGLKIVVLRGSNLHPIYGGALELDYLYNGVTRSRKSFEMSLERVGDKWQLRQGKKTMTHIHMFSNKKLWKTIGIKNIGIIK